MHSIFSEADIAMVRVNGIFIGMCLLIIILSKKFIKIVFKKIFPVSEGTLHRHYKYVDRGCSGKQSMLIVRICRSR
jgi:hypothetical protein